jgi:HEAT repeat protein
VARALRSVGASAIPSVARELSDPSARSNAETYLVSYGGSAATQVRPYLYVPDEDTRIAAEETLGEMRDRNSVPKLLSLYQTADPAERKAAFAALASIGELGTESTMEAVLSDPSQTADMRGMAGFGLGRIATAEAAKVLWQFSADHDATVREQVLNALQVCGDVALRVPETRKGAQLAVAAGVRSSLSDRIIERDLADPELSVVATRSTVGREGLADAVASELAMPRCSKNGEFAEAAVDALDSTARGRSLLARFRRDPNVEGFIARRRVLSKAW